MTHLPLVSVVVPAYNAAETLGVTLQAVLAQDYPNLEVLVVSDGSRDGTATVALNTGDSRVRVVEHAANQGLAATYATGVGTSSGSLVMFLHSDCQLGSRSWISQAMTHFHDAEVGWVTGYYETLKPDATSLVDQAFAVLRGELHGCYAAPSARPQPVPFSEGKCDLIRREALEAIGGIPRILRRSGEDQLMSYAVRSRGWKILKDPSLVTYQHYATDRPFRLIVGNLKKEFVHGKTQAVVNLRHSRTVLADLMNPTFAARKGSHPVFKLGAFVATLSALTYAGLALNIWGLLPVVACWGILASYYIWKSSYAGISVFSRLTPLIVALGFLSYLPYGIGLLWGVARYLLLRVRLYTRPI